MQQVSKVLNNQTQLVADFISELEKSLTQMGLDGGCTSEATLKKILKDFEQNFLSRVGIPLNNNTIEIMDIDSKRVENGKTYTVYYY